jgi:hypothetical protein
MTPDKVVVPTVAAFDHTHDISITVARQRWIHPTSRIVEPMSRPLIPGSTVGVSCGGVFA